MRISQKTKLFPLFALMLVIGAFLFAGTTAAYAAEDSPDAPTLVVKEVWLTGDTLHISVTDSAGECQTLELNLREYAKSTDEYVTVQATDSEGRTSNSVSFKNPYYVTVNETTVNSDEESSAGQTSDTPSESAVSAGNPFTPDGTGTVLDNATDGDGKEFFTVETPDGNTFYLIVDRQRSSDNVYLLNTVTEDDLASLAKSGNGKSESVIPSVTTPTPAATTATPEPTPTPSPEPQKSNNGGTIAFIVIAALAVGGAGYYFKVLRLKKDGAAASDDYGDEPEDDFDDDKELEVDDDDGEDGDDE